MIVFLDSSALIYHFEGSIKHRKAVLEVLQEVKKNHPQARIAVSRLAVMECRVKPLREQNTALLLRYDEFFRQAHIVELIAAVVDEATKLRAVSGLKTPDALQAASALSLVEAVCFVTGDTGFARVPNLKVVLLKLANG